MEVYTLLHTLVDTARVHLMQDQAHTERSLDDLAQLLLDRGSEIDGYLNQFLEG